MALFLDNQNPMKAADRGAAGNTIALRVIATIATLLMSALAVFLGLLLWTWIWGAWGTILAVPMLVMVKSVTDHVPRLKPLGRLMAP